MTMIANVLALALIVADGPPALPTAIPNASKPRPDADPAPMELWNLTLREAIRIGLDNSEVVRVISLRGMVIPICNCFSPPSSDVKPVVNEPPDGADIAIAPLNRDGSIWEFQAGAMAHVRSIERQYWALWSLQARLKAREDAVKEGEAILREARADLEVDHACVVEIAEAEQHLESLKLNLVVATSVAIAGERQLRDLLGLPQDDNRRIVAASAPIEARVQPVWEACLREMQGSQPDLVQQRALVRSAELQLLVARNQLLPLLGTDALHQLAGLGSLLDQSGPDLAEFIRRDAARRYPAGLDPSEAGEPEFINRHVGLVIPMPIHSRLPLGNVRQAQYRLLRQRSALRRITHEATHSLARMFLEVEAHHMQFRTARRLNLAAKRRLEVQRASYEEGQITLDRLLDDIGQQANAIAQEAHYQARYNTSLATLEEAKGTLLAYDGIAIDDRPWPRKAYIQAKDREAAPASFEQPAEAPDSLPPPASPVPGGKTFRLKARLVPGGLDLDIEVREIPPAAPSSP